MIWVSISRNLKRTANFKNRRKELKVKAEPDRNFFKNLNLKVGSLTTDWDKEEAQITNNQIVKSRYCYWYYNIKKIIKGFCEKL